MEIYSKSLSDKILYAIIVCYLISIPYSEAIKNTTIVLMLCYFIFQLVCQNLSLRKDLSNIAILTHIFVATIGIYFGVNSNESISQVGDVFKIGLAFLFFKEVNLHFISFEKILNYVFFGFIIAVSIALINIIYFDYHRLELRSVGSINRSATYIMYTFVLSLSVASVYKSNSTRILSMSSLILSAISIVLGGSRMAIFSLPLVIICYFFLSRKMINKKSIYLLIVLFIVLFALVLHSYSNDSRVFDKIALGFTDITRIQIWISALNIWMENNFWFGIGVGNSIFFDVNSYFQYARSGLIDNFHNVYLDMFVERGVFGLVTFLLFMCSIFFNKYNKISKIPSLLPLLVFSLLLMGLANITFRYEFALLFVTIIGAFLNPRCAK
jgi:O-antigen ligase